MSRKARKLVFVIAVVIVTGGSVAGYSTRARWWPAVRAQLLLGLGAVPSGNVENMHDEGHDDGHDHGHAGHDETNSLELSTQAQGNIGLKVGEVSLTAFDRKISIPGLICERPGRTTLAITAPLSGIVTQIHPIQGEAVQSAQMLFDLRLAHEELVQAQGDFLRTAEELDVIEREIKRLEKIAAEGGIPGRQVLERQYEQQTKQAVLRAQHQALLLHGLTDPQVNGILTTRTLLQNLTVAVPGKAPSSDAKPKKLYVVQEVRVEQGQSVSAGETLAVLSDHSELFIEGNAFDKDVAAISKAIEENWSVEAVLEIDESRPQIIRDLKILYVAGKVDPESRTFHFYVSLPNVLLHESVAPGSPRFISWRYKPGQRVQLTVPVEQWKDRIVLPVDAVAQDGVETYVFLPNGDHFDRKPVGVEYRDRFSVVLANDGSIFSGSQVVLAGAQQMQLALKNKSGGAPDPHAGHNH